MRLDPVCGLDLVFCCPLVYTDQCSLSLRYHSVDWSDECCSPSVCIEKLLVLTLMRQRTLPVISATVHLLLSHKLLSDFVIVVQEHASFSERQMHWCHFNSWHPVSWENSCLLTSQSAHNTNVCVRERCVYLAVLICFKSQYIMVDNLALSVSR